MQIDDLLEKYGFCARHVLDGLTGYGRRQEADEIARVTGFESDPDLAVRFEPTNSRAMSCTRVNNHERPARRIYFNRLWRDDPDQHIVDRPRQRPPIDDEFHVVVKHVRRSLGQILTKLISALTHDVQ